MQRCSCSPQTCATRRTQSRRCSRASGSSNAGAISPIEQSKQRRFVPRGGATVVLKASPQRCTRRTRICGGTCSRSTSAECSTFSGERSCLRRSSFMADVVCSLSSAAVTPHLNSAVGTAWLYPRLGSRFAIEPGKQRCEHVEARR